MRRALHERKKESEIWSNNCLQGGAFGVAMLAASLLRVSAASLLRVCCEFVADLLRASCGLLSTPFIEQVDVSRRARDKREITPGLRTGVDLISARGGDKRGLGGWR